MILKIRLIVSFLIFNFFCFSQQVNAVYKIADLLKRIDNKSDTLYVVNFWATWCVPCVKELPAFDSLNLKRQNEKIKVLLVCLDFKDEIKLRVDPFLKKHNYKSECVLLDEINGNDFINQIDKKWSGSIPATLAIRTIRKQRYFVEKKVTLPELEVIIQNFK